MSNTPSILSSNFKEKMAQVIKSKKIEVLRKQLTETDYIFIKLKEYEEVGLPQPYTDDFIADKHAERQAIRDQINSLE